MAPRDDKDKNKIRREKLADHLYNIAKLSFAGLVIGGLAPVFTGTVIEDVWPIVVLGIVMTFAFSYCANRILK